jgi:alcohol dehydrogenase YqhD (iron-dependent ADH family)
MEDFSFQNKTAIRFGKHHIDEELHDAVAQFGQKVLLTYGGGSIKKSGLYDRVQKALADLQVFELSGIAPNPKIDSIRDGQKLAKTHDIDVILSVGGGSVLDASKVIASAKFYDGDAWDLVADRGAQSRSNIDQLPVVDILTLSATGSEMNAGSVISNSDLNIKLGTYGPNTPAVSFLDPQLTYSVSKWQTAAGSFDVFSHLAEQYFDRATANDVTSGIIEGMMRSVIKWAPVALAEPDNYDARANLMWGATMALNGIARSGNKNGWTVHPIEHELSAYYDITHGVGLAILTPRWMKSVLSGETQARFARYGREVWHLTGKDDLDVAQRAIQATYDWIKSLDIPMTLPGVAINSEEKFVEMAQEAVRIGNLNQNGGYVNLTVDDVTALYHDSMTTAGFE